MLSNQIDPHQHLILVQDICIETGKITRYNKGKFLGKGGFARCYQFTKQDSGQIFAAKIIQKSNLIKPRSKQKLISELSIHSSLFHQNIVRFKHSFQDNLNVYILLQLCPNSTLNDLLKKKKRFTESQTQNYMAQLLQGIIYIHNNRILHRDLKLGNLFLSQNMSIKIGDFGLAAKLQIFGEKRRTICGTPNYIAPQILDTSGHSYEADIWSFGIIIYTLTFGRPPFQCKDIKQTYKKIKSGLFTIPEGCSVALKNLILSILQKQPSKRLTLKQIKEHDFFNYNLGLTRQISIKMRQSLSKRESNKQLSDNGKLYTNINDIGCSQDLIGTMNKQNRDKSPDNAINNLQKSNSYFGTPIKQKMIRTKSQNILKDTALNKQNQEQQNEQGIYVRKWIDYSNKYGIGYILSNNTIGVYFNDSTKIIAINKQIFYYIQKIDKTDLHTKYNYTNYPPQLKKKINILNHFKTYLLTNQKNFNYNIKSALSVPIYLKRWFRAKHAVIFRMNNKTVQVIFTDGTELIINSVNKVVAYFNKNRQKSIYNINQIMLSCNKEAMKRFQYTKQIINSMTKTSQEKKNEQIFGSIKKQQKLKKQKSQISIKEQKNSIIEKRENNLRKTMLIKTPEKLSYKQLHNLSNTSKIQKRN